VSMTWWAISARPQVQGLCDYLINQIGEKEAQERGVVLGFDGRAWRI